MKSRFADAITPDGEGWELAGDQLYVDFDLSVDNAPPATRLKVGTAMIEIAAHPHSGCAKYSKRFDRGVLMTTRADEGKRLRLRGVNARVIVLGVVRRGDLVRRVSVDDCEHFWHIELGVGVAGEQTKDSSLRPCRHDDLAAPVRRECLGWNPATCVIGTGRDFPVLGLSATEPLGIVE